MCLSKVVNLYKSILSTQSRIGKSREVDLWRTDSEKIDQCWSLTNLANVKAKQDGNISSEDGRRCILLSESLIRSLYTNCISFQARVGTKNFAINITAQMTIIG